MLKQTIHLFIKACIIGILINVGLAQVSSTPATAEENILQQNEQSILSHQPSTPSK